MNPFVRVTGRPITTSYNLFRKKRSCCEKRKGNKGKGRHVREAGDILTNLNSGMETS